MAKTKQTKTSRAKKGTTTRQRAAHTRSCNVSLDSLNKLFSGTKQIPVAKAFFTKEILGALNITVNVDDLIKKL